RGVGGGAKRQRARGERQARSRAGGAQAESPLDSRPVEVVRARDGSRGAAVLARGGLGAFRAQPAGCLPTVDLLRRPLGGGTFVAGGPVLALRGLLGRAAARRAAQGVGGLRHGARSRPPPGGAPAVGTPAPSPWSPSSGKVAPLTACGTSPTADP